MNDLQPDPVAVQAPAHALAWSMAYGFIDDLDEVSEAHLEGDLVFDVNDDGYVAHVEGDAPLAVAVRIDRMLTELRRAQRALADRLTDVEDRQAGVDTDTAMELVALKARLHRLERQQEGDQ